MNNTGRAADWISRAVKIIEDNDDMISKDEDKPKFTPESQYWEILNKRADNESGWLAEQCGTEGFWKDLSKQEQTKNWMTLILNHRRNVYVQMLLFYTLLNP